MNAESLIGTRFGRLSVLGVAQPPTKRHPRVSCRCDCGKIKEVDASNLVSGKSRSCGCLRAELSGARQRAQSEDLAPGTVFGRLTVHQRLENSSSRHHIYQCACECGKTTKVDKINLLSGGTRSCGCLNNEARVLRFTHGRTGSPEYRAWRNMLNRCQNPKVTGYENYGGRGITVCDRWRQSFENFLADMDVRPSPAHSIDRIDHEGHYCPENCRWATDTEQGRNKRNNVLLELRGVQRPASEWAEIVGIHAKTLLYRKRAGWSDEKALTTPVKGQ